MRLLSILIVCMLALLLGASACTSGPPSGGERETATPGGESETPEITPPETEHPDFLSEDQEEIGASAAGADEEPDDVQEPATDPVAAIVPEGWPEDVPVMDGFIVVFAMDTGDGMAGTAMGDTPAQEVADFYGELPEWGEPATTKTVPTDGGEAYTMIYDRDGEVLTITVEDTNEGTRLVIGVERD